MYTILKGKKPNVGSKNIKILTLKNTLLSMQIDDAIIVNFVDVKKSSLRKYCSELSKNTDFKLRVEYNDDHSCIVFKLNNSKIAIKKDNKKAPEPPKERQELPQRIIGIMKTRLSLGQDNGGLKYWAKKYENIELQDIDIDYVREMVREEKLKKEASDALVKKQTQPPGIFDDDEDDPLF